MHIAYLVRDNLVAVVIAGGRLRHHSLLNSFLKQSFDSGKFSFLTSLFQNCSVSISKLRLHFSVACNAPIVFVQEADMNVDAENSTNSLFDTTRRSAELLIDNYLLGYVGIGLTFALLV